MKKIKTAGIAILIILAVIAVVFVGVKSINSLLNKSKGSVAIPDETMNGNYQVAIFAGGCFWCMEPPFEKLAGVKEVISGYTGGTVKNPTYEQVSSGTTGHVEAVQVIFDPKRISYQQLLDVFWRQVDPTDAGGQFVDRGDQYKSVIFYMNEEQHQEAIISKQNLEKSNIFPRPIVTDIRQTSTFYQAEEYHQDYYKKNTLQYKFYRFNSGRDQYLEKIWGHK